MSNDEDDRKDRDPNDPYSFFKLAPMQDDDDKGDAPKKKRPFPLMTVLLLILLGLFVANMVLTTGMSGKTIEFSAFRSKIENGEINTVVIGETYVIGYKSDGTEEENKEKGGLGRFLAQSSDREEFRAVGILTEEFFDFLNVNQVTYSREVKHSGILLQIFLSVFPFILLFAIMIVLFKRMGGGVGGMGSVFGNGVGRSKAVSEGKVKTRFEDVAGEDEAKEELVEVVDFLKQPKKYTDIGGKIPKGVLLVGPPGTGKTLLARAVAGEAGVTFFRISGSDFVEMFVGMGASRVRDLFRTAREKAPCIIFIDELDAIGKSRVNNLGGNDEREQTLNQLLVEMDGFDNEKGLIVLAATNRPDVLDPALLRPGRFDRQVVVDKPDVKGREAILKIHAKNVKVDSDVDFAALALATSGLAGADLANIVNEAAILAVRNGRKMVIAEDFDEAIEKTQIGLQKKSRVVKEKERQIVAYHETGHALVSAFTPGSDTVHKITIIPRGVGIGGYTLHRSDDESFLMCRSDLIGRVDVLLGGRAAEEITFGEVSTGASNDISRATDIFKSMITDYGMSDKFRNMTLGKSGRGYGAQEPELVREFSEETQKYIDEEIARLMEERYNYVLKLLKDQKDLLDYVAKRLLEKETIDGKEFEEIVEAKKNLESSYPEKSDGTSSADSKTRTTKRSAVKTVTEKSETEKKSRGRKPKTV